MKPIILNMHVLMPAYNVESSIQLAMQTVLNQTYPNTVLIIYNDGSTDKTLDQINGYLHKHRAHKAKTIILNNSINHGVAHARKQLLATSKAINPEAYLLWLDADDRYTDLNFIENILAHMQKTCADIGLFNYDIIFEESISESSKQGLDIDKQNSIKVLEKIAAAPNHIVSAETCPDIMQFTSFGWTKCYAPSVIFPQPANYPFEDFVYMAALLNANRITALPPDYMPIEYWRHTNSICGQRKSENFTAHIPQQLMQFLTHTQARAKTAKNFAEQKFNQFEEILKTAIKNHQPGFTTETLAIFNQKRGEVLAYKP